MTAAASGPAAGSDPALGPLPGAEAPPALQSETLFDGRREIIIRHRNVEYRLRITRGDKLILTK